MPTDLRETDRRCHICGNRLLAALIGADAPMWRKSTPVFVCSRCDFEAVPESRDLHADLID